MPEYLAPGVYVEEIEIGAKPIEGVSTSTAGFLGQTERGPVGTRLVTGFEQFLRLYGGYIEESDLAYAVEGFFRNGGQRCFIGRIVGSGAAESSLTMTSGDTEEGEEGEEDLIEVKALGPGTWGDKIAVKVADASLSKTGLFKLIVAYGKDVTPTEVEGKLVGASVTEIYDNLSSNPGSSDYYVKRVNGVSNLVLLEQIKPGTPSKEEFKELTPLSEGGNGGTVGLSSYQGASTDPDKRSGLAAFEGVDEISIVCIPDENKETLDGLTKELVNHCEKMRDRFAILQSKQSAGSVGDLRPPVDSKYAAFYYPWIKVLDPITNTYKLVPPGGHIAGVYARSDQERGVHKAPANEVLRGVSELEVDVSKGDQDMLNPRGVNCIRAFSGRGIRVWGARATSSDPLWKYVNVRRLFLFIEESIDEGTQWVVFEPNNEMLWARVRQTINQFLTGVWKDGALMGLNQDEAFFVKCDRTTMTQDDIDNGRLIVLIGVAPVKPAEFVIFRIAQVAKGSEIAE